MDKVAQDRRGRYVEQRRRYSHNELTRFGGSSGLGCLKRAIGSYSYPAVMIGVIVADPPRIN